MQSETDQERRVRLAVWLDQLAGPDDLVDERSLAELDSLVADMMAELELTDDPMAAAELVRVIEALRFLSGLRG